MKISSTRFLIVLVLVLVLVRTRGLYSRRYTVYNSLLLCSHDLLRGGVYRPVSQARYMIRGSTPVLMCRVAATIDM